MPWWRPIGVPHTARSFAYPRRALERVPADARADRRAHDAFRIETDEHLSQTVVAVAEQPVHADLDVVEEERELLLGCADLDRDERSVETRRIGVDDEERETGAARFGVAAGSRDDHHRRCLVDAGDERFRAANPVGVAVTRRCRRDVVAVGTRVGLGDGEHHLGPGGHWREPALLLRMGAELCQQLPADRGRHEDQQERAALRGELLGHDGELVEAAATSAVLLGEMNAEEPEVADRLPERVGSAAGARLLCVVLVPELPGDVATAARSISCSVVSAKSIRRHPCRPTGRGHDARRADRSKAPPFAPAREDAGMSDPLPAQYSRRFGNDNESRQAVWRVLVDAWFSRYVDGAQAVLDLGCGWGHFINTVDVERRYTLDLNADARRHLDPAVELIVQPASEPWGLASESLDLVFTSNFLEHLPDRDAISATLAEAFRCLRSGGKLVCLGPNIRYAGGAYWDFFDHVIPLTDRSLTEALELGGFDVEEAIPRFLPFTMSGKPPPPASAIRLYLRFPVAWRLVGRQFLVVARKP